MLNVYRCKWGIKYYASDYKDNNNSMNEVENKEDND